MIYAHKLIADAIKSVVGKVHLDVKIVSFASGDSSPAHRMDLDGTSGVYERLIPTHDSEDFAYTRMVTGDSRFVDFNKSACGSIMQVPIRLVVYKKTCCRDDLAVSVISKLSAYPFSLYSINFSIEETTSAETTGIQHELINTDYAYFYIDLLVKVDIADCNELCNINKIVCP